MVTMNETSTVSLQTFFQKVELLHKTMGQGREADAGDPPQLESLGTRSSARFLIFRLLLSIKWGGMIVLVVGALRLGSMMQGKGITGDNQPLRN
jgi:hypothetical protein